MGIFRSFIYWLERQSHREGGRKGVRERDIPSTGTHPKWPKRLELGWSEARSHFLVSHVGVGVQGLGPSFAAFPGKHSKVLCWKRSSQDLKQQSYGMLAPQAVALPIHQSGGLYMGNSWMILKRNEVCLAFTEKRQVSLTSSKSWIQTAIISLHICLFIWKIEKDRETSFSLFTRDRLD